MTEAVIISGSFFFFLERKKTRKDSCLQAKSRIPLPRKPYRKEIECLPFSQLVLGFILERKKDQEKFLFTIRSAGYLILQSEGSCILIGYSAIQDFLEPITEISLENH